MAFPNDIRSTVDPNWVNGDIPRSFRGWGRTDYAGSCFMEEANWTPIVNTAWGCSDKNTWCCWDNDGIIAWMWDGNGPHWVREPNKLPAFEVTALY